MGGVTSKMRERAKIFTILRRIVGLRNDKSGEFWPLLSQRHTTAWMQEEEQRMEQLPSRSIHSLAASW
jgi:hypothetical protein